MHHVLYKICGRVFSTVGDFDTSQDVKATGLTRGSAHGTALSRCAVSFSERIQARQYHPRATTRLNSPRSSDGLSTRRHRAR
jgi:hypothetical protein